MATFCWIKKFRTIVGLLDYILTFWAILGIVQSVALPKTSSVYIKYKHIFVSCMIYSYH